MNVIQKVDQFLRIRRDWFGEGANPVPIEEAQKRADVCNSGDPMEQPDGTHRCRKNYQGGWLWSMAVQMAINAQMRLRRMMQIKVNGEDRLKTCEVCGCKLLLKIHVPIKHLYRHITPEQVQNFPDHCWIKQEIKQLTKP